jgi:hypothetical protein
MLCNMIGSNKNKVTLLDTYPSMPYIPMFLRLLRRLYFTNSRTLVILCQEQAASANYGGVLV